MTMVFTPPTGLLDTSKYPTTPANEAAARQQFMDLLYQLRDYMNAKNPAQTTADITYYVSTTGNDANDGLTLGAALRTIQTAVSKLPQIINHAVTISAADGTYLETANIAGFFGKGSITIIGNPAAPDNVVVNRILFNGDGIPVTVKGVKVSDTVNNAVEIGSCINITLDTCKVIDASSSKYAVYAETSNVYVKSCTLSNRYAAIWADNNVHIRSEGNTGSGNYTALIALDGGVISKKGTQPTGTTADYADYGGVIR